jgi:hypothetical protein
MPNVRGLRIQDHRTHDAIFVPLSLCVFVNRKLGHLITENKAILVVPSEL